MNKTYLLPSYQTYSEESPIHYSAKGSYVWTQYGKTLDLCSGYWTVNFGHGHKQIARAALRGFFAHLFGELHGPAMELAQKLCERAGYAKVLFNTSGTDAMDSAIRMALQCSMSHYGEQKTAFVTVRLGFHGTSGFTLATSGFPERRKWLPAGFPLHVLGSWATDPHLDRAQAEQKLAEQDINWESCCGFLFEPMLAVGGVRIINPCVYGMVASKCHQIHGLVIADEITTGLGRMGTFLASQRLEPKPDIVCLGKALTNGVFPLSATLISEDVWNALKVSSTEETGEYLYGSTYGGHPSGCLAALKVLELIDERLMKEISLKGQWFSEKLECLAKRHKIVKTVRSAGFAWALEFPSREVSSRVWLELLKQGVRVAEEGRPLVIIPPFTISHRELGSALQIMDAVLASFGGS